MFASLKRHFSGKLNKILEFNIEVAILRSKLHLRLWCRLNPSVWCVSAPRGRAPKRGRLISENENHIKKETFQPAWPFSNQMFSLLWSPCMSGWGGEVSTWRWRTPRRAGRRQPDCGDDGDNDDFDLYGSVSPSYIWVDHLRQASSSHNQSSFVLVSDCDYLSNQKLKSK